MDDNCDGAYENWIKVEVNIVVMVMMIIVAIVRMRWVGALDPGHS